MIFASPAACKNLKIFFFKVFHQTAKSLGETTRLPKVDLFLTKQVKFACYEHLKQVKCAFYEHLKLLRNESRLFGLTI